MLAKARDAAGSAGVENQVRFEIGDARRLPFPDHHFDLERPEATLWFRLSVSHHLVRKALPRHDEAIVY